MDYLNGENWDIDKFAEPIDTGLSNKDIDFMINMNDSLSLSIWDLKRIEKRRRFPNQVKSRANNRAKKYGGYSWIRYSLPLFYTDYSIGIVFVDKRCGGHVGVKV